MSAKEHGEMMCCKWTTYAAKKADLLKQLGYHGISARSFKGMTEIQIDNRARQIMSRPPKGYRM